MLGIRGLPQYPESLHKDVIQAGDKPDLQGASLFAG